ncbi:cytochrome P450 [Croceicoccus estronivorus]|uniref:cytochrome P450 n=1 Tax=Croceicoccus estronivorus TaxID=1172626 RepID=UPI0009EE86AB|nr:cytochrome P450 [Croceicoccus estronivorus]
MAADYDPFSTEAMSDPHPLYRELRAEGCPHFVEARRAWALTLYDDLRKASLTPKWLDFRAGQTPAQLMLGEPVPHTFMTMNAPENRKWRGLLEPFYAASAVNREVPRLKGIVDSELAALKGLETFDAYHDFANQVMCINAGYNLGIPRAQAIHARDLIDRMILNRVPGQVGASTPDSQQAAGELMQLLAAHVQQMRADPEAGGPHGRRLRDAEVDGQRLTDENLLSYLFSLLVVGSETTPMAVAGTLYYLARHPDQKAMVLADHGLLHDAFRETCRYDQPTNMLARRAAMDFELNGANVKQGDNLLFIYASANRDDARFPDPDRYDITRPNEGDLSFGVGSHFCLGAYLAQTAAGLMLNAIFDAIEDYEVIEDACERAYGEHLNGFIRMTVSPRWK